MAIIKCPECGRQISDKAPTCPNCGVEIAGKVVKCPDCFNVYFKDEETCPNCHRHNDAYQPPQTEAPMPQQQRVQIPVPTPAQMASTSSSRQTETPIGRSRTGRTTPPPIDGSPRKSHALVCHRTHHLCHLLLLLPAGQQQQRARRIRVCHAEQRPAGAANLS